MTTGRINQVTTFTVTRKQDKTRKPTSNLVTVTNR